MDIEYLLLLQNLREATGGVLDSLMSYLTTYGEGLLTMMLVAAIYWCVSKSDGMYTLFSWGTGNLLNGVLKVTACAYRPWIRDSRVKPVSSAIAKATGYSFPSGHTTNATAVYGSLALNKKLSKALRILMGVMILLVGFSRNYLGVHTPQDVLVGFAATLVVLLLVRRVLKLVDEKPNLDVVVLIVGLLLNVAVIVYAACKSYPMDYDDSGALIVDPAKMVIDTYKNCGFCLGALISWFVDRRWLHYEVEGTPMHRVTCYVAGILGYFVVLYVLVPLLPSDLIGSILNNFVRLVYVMLVVPFLIQRVSRRSVAKQEAQE